MIASDIVGALDTCIDQSTLVDAVFSVCRVKFPEATPTIVARKVVNELQELTEAQQLPCDDWEEAERADKRVLEETADVIIAAIDLARTAGLSVTDIEKEIRTKLRKIAARNFERLDDGTYQTVKIAP